MKAIRILAAAALAAAAAGSASAAPAPGQPADRFAIPAPPALPYGAPINIEQAKKVAAAAQAEARRRGLFASIAVVEPSGELVYFEKADNASYSAMEVSIAKARSAARWRRTTKFDSDRLALGVDEVLALPGVMPALGGEVIVLDGKIIGAIGETSGRGENDIALAGANALK